MTNGESLSTQGTTVVTLPPGVKVGPGRETSQLNELGEVTQGMVFPLTLANGGRATVFVPYSQITNPQIVTNLIAERVNAITAITG